MSEYYIPTGPGEAEFTEKRSRFLGHVRMVETEDEARAFIAEMKKKYYDARHNCWCYLIRGGAERYSDDGEPQGTGGVPVLDVLQKAGLTDVCVVVTRYFGGVLLGANGLVRAYSQGCKIAVNAARIMEMHECSRFEFSCDYTMYSKVSYVLPEFEVIKEQESFADVVSISVLVKNELCKAFRDKITDISNGQIELSEETNLVADFA